MNAFFIAPGDQRRLASDACSRRTRRWSSGSSSWPGSRPSSRRPDRFADRRHCLHCGDLQERRSAAATRRAPTSTRCSRCRRRRSRCETSAGFTPTGVGSVCYPRGRGGCVRQHRRHDVASLLDADRRARRSSSAPTSSASPGCSCRRDPAELAGLSPTCTRSTRTLEDRASAPRCCARWSRSPTRQGRQLGLVYLYKQGTFYPFAPDGAQTRDNLLELQVRDTLAGELPIEPDLSRWLAVWGAPGS